MPSFGQESKDNLAQAHPDLQRLFNAVIEEYDCKVLDAQRNHDEQEAAFRKGNSRAHFGQSPHNYIPAIALDVVPYPIDWKDLKRFRALAKIVKAKAVELDIPIQWGGDWTSIKDYPHYELSPWRTYAKQASLVPDDYASKVRPTVTTNSVVKAASPSGNGWLVALIKAILALFKR